VRQLLSTYRLQLNEDFTLADARAIVPYLHAYGVSHVYLSPVLTARPGSTHGYDVADPSQVNPELGGEEALRALADEAHRLGLGVLVDIVPNHMGVGPSNPYWEDLLMHGEGARYARWFDVDWRSHPRRIGKIVLPVLGDEIDAVIARGELGLSIADHGGVRITYFDASWPVNPATIPEAIQLVQNDPHAREAAEEWARGEEGKARLRELLRAQHYTLTFWRCAPSEINYRRFFDVNELAALRMEDPAVFDESHAKILELVRGGVVDGLRIDHVDGLRDPLGYLERLRAAVGDIPILVEKILSPGEHLRREWPIQGTTGYEFMNDVETLFIHDAGARTIENAYRSMRRLAQRERVLEFEEVAREGKLLVLRGALRADMLRLGRQLLPLVREEPVEGGEAAAERRAAHTARTLADGLTQLVASLPVYRTYIDGRDELPHADDRDVIERAVARAQEHVTPEEHAVVARVARTFLSPLAAGDPDHDARLDFILRFQQTSGPATAKGVEDTALYRYFPLASRNEVGGEPDRLLHDAVERFHAANAERARDWPLSILATNTHDTKRSADVRARIDVLSEIPEEWQRHVQRWRRFTRKHRVALKGRLTPDTNTEYLIYQTLVGIWPSPATGRRADDVPPREWLEHAKERVDAYIMKAVKEGKVFTTWTEPDAEYEEGVKRFVHAILTPDEESPFLADLSRFVATIARAGMWNALSRVLVHYTAPGTPDTYQGDECWTHTLVDPDNRRPVDFDARRRMVEEVAANFPASIDADLATARLADYVREPEDDRLKYLLAWRTLQARRAHPDLFAAGGYEPLRAEGDHAPRLFAYARTHGGRSAIVIAPRLLVALGVDAPNGRVSAATWAGTRLPIPEALGGGPWRSALTGREVRAEGGALDVASILTELPLALLLPA
jgi:(1->4)-alpha-D-glucan 1-alpha-D-glucosylmutase